DRADEAQQRDLERGEMDRALEFFAVDVVGLNRHHRGTAARGAEQTSGTCRLSGLHCGVAGLLCCWVAERSTEQPSNLVTKQPLQRGAFSSRKNATNARQNHFLSDR